MSDEKPKGDWGVVVRVPQEDGTFKAFFLDGIDRVDEKTARVAFGLAIRAGELGLLVEGANIDAVRLLKGGVMTEHGALWDIVQEHVTDKCERFRQAVAKGDKAAPVETCPYREDCFHPGVPCMGGAWGSATSCAMHWGLPLDNDNVCVEGRRGAKYLGLVVVPRAMQERWGWHSMMTRREMDLVVAAARTDLVHRGKDEQITTEQLRETCEIFERELELVTKEKKPAQFDTTANTSHDETGGLANGKANGT